MNMSEEAKQIPELRAGMVVRVHEKIKDVSPKGEERDRIQLFEGTVLGTRGSGNSKSFRVLKNSDGWQVEKIFPLRSPNVAKIEVLKQMKVRHAKIDFLKRAFTRKIKEVKLKK
jgi:large subunit ribosomal protein L19